MWFPWEGEEGGIYIEVKGKQVHIQQEALLTVGAAPTSFLIIDEILHS